MKARLLSLPGVRGLARMAKPFLPASPLGLFRNYARFWGTYRAYAARHGAPPCRLADLNIQIHDWHTTTPLSFYFHQDTWAFRKIVQARPDRHVDVGSTALLVGCIAAIVPTTSVDVRPLAVDVPGLQAREGNITEMPFPDASIPSISALCVIEHIGLGRYGDPIDPDGSRKAARELVRVLAPGGNLYVSAPIGRSYIAFNAHRSFTRPEFTELFAPLQLVDFQLVSDQGVIAEGNPDELGPLQVGLFHFRSAGGAPRPA